MPNKTPEPERYEGSSGAMRTSPWMAAEDILDKGDVKVTIEYVNRRRNVEFEMGRKEPVVYSLKFVGATKELILNATNRKTLKDLFGVSTSKWAGKIVVIYTTKAKFAGKNVDAIRIKAAPK